MIMSFKIHNLELRIKKQAKIIPQKKIKKEINFTNTCMDGDQFQITLCMHIVSLDFITLTIYFRH